MQDIYICAFYKFTWTSTTVNPLMPFFKVKSVRFMFPLTSWLYPLVDVLFQYPDEVVYLVEDMTGGLGKVALKAGNDSMPLWVDCFWLKLGGFWRSVPLVILFEYVWILDHLHGWLLLGQTVKEIVEEIWPLMHLELTKKDTFLRRRHWQTQKQGPILDFDVTVLSGSWLPQFIFVNPHLRATSNTIQ